jgi:hypothetical protein
MINLWILGMPCLWTNQFRNHFPTDLRTKLTKLIVLPSSRQDLEMPGILRDENVVVDLSPR